MVFNWQRSTHLRNLVKFLIIFISIFLFLSHSLCFWSQFSPQVLQPICTAQRRQSGLKTGGRWSGPTKLGFFQSHFREISISSGNFTKKFDFSKQIFEKFIFSRQIFNLFRQIFEFFYIFSSILKQMLIFQAKIAHLQLLLVKLYSIYLQKSPLSDILPVHDKI